MKIKTKCAEVFNSRLRAYSATAGAALLATPVAQASIQNITGLSLSLNLPQNAGYQTLSFNAGPFSGAMGGFNANYSSLFLGTGSSYIGTARLQGNIAGGGGYASRLAKGVAFSGMYFSSPANRLAMVSHYISPSGYGNFVGRSGYVAFKTNSYYGWLKVKVNLDSHDLPNQISLVDNGNGVFGAYDNINDVVADGFTVGAVAAPEPSTVAISGLGLLAFGAAGVRELRRRRRAKA